MYFEKAVSGKSEWPLYLVSIVIIIISYALLGQAPLTGVLMYKMSKDQSIGMEELESFGTDMDFSVFGISSNFGFFLMLLIFVISTLALMLCVKLIHRRPFIRLITPLGRINWSKILFGFGLWMGLALIMEGLMYFMDPEAYTMVFKPGSFVVLLLLALLVMPIQTSFEELFFRGYLMPWFGKLVRNKWVPLILTSVLFGLVHGMNPEIEKYGFATMQVYYISAGMFLGLITVLDDSLELALGVHAATNIFGATLLSYEGSVLQTDTIFKSSEVNPNIMIVGLYIAAAIFIFICSKKYNWKGFSRLTEPVETYDQVVASESDVLVNDHI